MAPPTTVDIIMLLLRSVTSLAFRKNTRLATRRVSAILSDSCGETTDVMNNTHPKVLIAPTGNSARRVVAYVLDLQRGGGRPPHKHDRAQLLAVTSGSIAVVAEGATFVAPPERGVWIPTQTLHETRHLASTRLRTLYIEAGACGALPDRTTVVQINPLMRELLSAIVARPR